MSRNWIDLLSSMNHQALAVVLIFGTGFIAALFWGISTVVRAMRGDSSEAQVLRVEVAALEDRLAALEQAVMTPHDTAAYVESR